MDGGWLELLQDSDSFTVRVHDLVHGNGLYWCGVLGMNQTIIKLAEGYFHSCKSNHMGCSRGIPVDHSTLYSMPIYLNMSQFPACCPWHILRWILLPLLPIVVIIFHLYLNSKLPFLSGVLVVQ